MWDTDIDAFNPTLRVLDIAGPLRPTPASLRRHPNHEEIPRRSIHKSLQYLRLRSEFEPTHFGRFLAKATRLTQLIVYTEQIYPASLLKSSFNERLCCSLTELCWLSNVPEQEAALAQGGKAFDSLLPKLVNLSLLTISSNVVFCQVLHLLPSLLTRLVLVGFDLVGFTDGYDPFAEVLRDPTRICTLRYFTVHDEDSLWEGWEKASLHALCSYRGIQFMFYPGVVVS
jgi:hypothetical protein